MEIVCSQPPRQPPNALDGRKLRTVGGKEQQLEVLAMGGKQRLKQFCAVVTRVVEHDHHFLVARAASEQSLQEDLEGDGVEHRGKEVDELAAEQADRAETGHGLSRRGMEDDGVFIFGRDPHATSGAVALEVAFVLAPQLNIAATRQTAEFF